MQKIMITLDIALDEDPENPPMEDFIHLTIKAPRAMAFALLTKFVNEFLTGGPCEIIEPRKEA